MLIQLMRVKHNDMGRDTLRYISSIYQVSENILCNYVQAVRTSNRMYKYMLNVDTVTLRNVLGINIYSPIASGGCFIGGYHKRHFKQRFYQRDVTLVLHHIKVRIFVQTPGDQLNSKITHTLTNTLTNYTQSSIEFNAFSCE